MLPVTKGINSPSDRSFTTRGRSLPAYTKLLSGTPRRGTCGASPFESRNPYAAGLHRAHNNSHVMHAPPFPTGSAPNQALINLDGILPTYGVPLWPNHAGAQLAEDLERSFVAGNPKLALELQGRLAGRLGGGEVSSPKPS